MNDANDNKLKSLQDLNSSIKEFNTRLEDLLEYRKEDKIKHLSDLNTLMKELNVRLEDLLESRKKDKIRNELNHTTQ